MALNLKSGAHLVPIPAPEHAPPVRLPPGEATLQALALQAVPDADAVRVTQQEFPLVLCKKNILKQIKNT